MMLSLSFNQKVNDSFLSFRDRDALIISTMDLLTSILAGFVIFTTFGHMAYLAGTEIEDVAQGGQN